MLLRDILSSDDPQIEALIRVIQHADADVLVLADIDYDLHLKTLDALADRIGTYPYRFALEPNRGKPSGHDINEDGRIGGPDDAYGYAEFRGQSGMAILSRLPVQTETVVSLSGYLWHELPNGLIPPKIPQDFPLSTTAHWIVPVETPTGGTLDILTWHATPPVFDGPEDRNGKRNHDETALWVTYLNGELPWAPSKTFILAGVANLDPVDGDGRADALLDLLSHPQLTALSPESPGGRNAANPDHRGNPALDTADFSEGPNRPGNLRVDYVLPSTNLTVLNTGVLWPLPDTSLGRDVERASRHRLVWVDIEIPDGIADGG